VSHPRATLLHVGTEPSSAVHFAETARRLGAAARAAGLAVPAFRSPPRVPGAARSIRRYPGGVVVSVQLRGRPFAQVVADMVDGVVVTNRLAGESAKRLRAALSDALEPEPVVPEPVAAGPPSLAPGARVAERQTQAA
jgi:hypothetical protein